MAQIKATKLDVPEGLIDDFPSGPLDLYRKQASFDWKELKLLLEGKELIEMKKKVDEYLSSDLTFTSRHNYMTLNDERKFAQAMCYKIVALDLFQGGIDPNTFVNIQRYFSYSEFGYYIKMLVGYTLVEGTILSMGTAKHESFLDDLRNGKVYGCFCLTEIAHGSNTKQMRTTATYDPDTKEFVINTPSQEDAKCWVGNLGESATHGIVFAQLYTAGQCHGVHAFLVPIRDPHTLQNYPGMTIGDMGAKAGLNGIDNGFVIFHNYRVPKDSLLNKNGDVTDDGKYFSAISDVGQRLTKSLGNLSMGRVSITDFGCVNMAKALAIAIRYAAVRRQFGPEGEEEIPIIEYQTHYWRLIPYVAAQYVTKYMANYCLHKLFEVMMGGDASSRPELHVLSCAGKSVASFLARDAIQECREACGGHGYLKVSGLSDIRNDHDANLTYEGDCNVILQQVSTYLIKLYQSKKAGGKIKTNFGFADIINDADSVLSRKCRSRSAEEMCNIENILSAYEFLLCFLLQEGNQKLQEESSKGRDPFTARNNCQVYCLRTLSIAYWEKAAIQKYYEFVRSEKVPRSLEEVLLKVNALYGLWSLEKHTATLYQGGFFHTPEAASYVREGVLRLCESLKGDVVALVDTFAPPDYLLNSALGASDGRVYDHLVSAFLRTPRSMERAPHWKTIIGRPILNSIALESKL